MSVYLDIINIEEMFNNLSEDPIIINDIIENNENFTGKIDKEKIKSLLLSEYRKSERKFTASCLCGLIKGDYRIGDICPRCNSIVKHPYGPLESKLWIRKLEGCEPFINPILWMLVRNFLMSRKKHNFDVLHWLSNTRYSLKDNREAKVIADEIMITYPEIERNYNYLSKHFIEVVSKIIFLKPFYSSKIAEYTESANQILDILHKNKHKLYADYIPIPHKTILVTEKTSKGTYMDYKTSYIQSIVWAVIHSNYISKPYILKNRMSSIMTYLSDFYDRYFKLNWGKKPGIFRRHISGTRACFSFRCVVTPLLSGGDHEEIHIPWRVAIIVLRPMLVNRLVGKGYTFTKVEEILNRCFYDRNDEVYEILENLIEESSYKGLPCLIVRNPSLKRGSIMRVFITNVKKDIEDNTVSYFTTIAKIKNGDFDGDEENIELLLDSKLTDACEYLAPHYNLPDPSEPYKISGYLFLPKPCISTISNCLADNEVPEMTIEQYKLLTGE